MTPTAQLPRVESATSRPAWPLPPAALLLASVPSVLAAYLAFRAGGYYPEVYSGVVLFLATALGLSAVASRLPLADLSSPVAVAAIALALLVVWTWSSAAWSDAPWRAVFEWQRTALYLLALLSCGAFASRFRVFDVATAGLAGVILAVCAAALATRLLPDVFSVEVTSVAPTLAPQRLSFPLGYWNALGAFAGIGTVLLLHLSSSLDHRPVIRAAAAAAIPVSATTIYFTFSRGAVGAVALGVVAYLAVGRSRGAVGAVLACVPGVALALAQSYSADLLSTSANTTAAAAGQGHRVAAWLFVAACLSGGLRLALVPLDRRLAGMPRAGAKLRRRLLAAATAVALLTLVGAVAVDAPQRAQTAYESFTKSESDVDARARLQAVTLSGRADLWDVSLQYFRADPLKGEGAGTFETQWFNSRPAPGEAAQGHSLYFETLGELGVVGFVLIVTAIGALLLGLLFRARAERRAAYGALFAATLLWAVHAGVDWDWEVTALGVPLFALAGIALAGSTDKRPAGSLAGVSNWPARVAIVGACVLLAATSVRAIAADSSLDASKQAFGTGDCRKASSEARSALSAVAMPGAREILGWCDLDAGRATAAAREMRAAIRLDPRHWRYRYELGIARAAAGRDPRRDVRLAHRLNPVGEMFTNGSALDVARTAHDWRRLAREAAAIDSRAAFR